MPAAMNEEASSRIDQMVTFIGEEAKEKAEEIRMLADEEFTKVKLQLVEAEKQRIRREYERKEAQVEANKKIQASKQLNEQRLKILQSKQGMIKDVFQAAKAALKAKTQNKAEYTTLMAELLVQAMKKINEPSVILQCREADISILEAALPIAEAKYQEVFATAAPQTTVDRKHFLSPAATSKAQEDDPDAATCLGGVVVTTLNGRIVVNNTIDTRLRIIEEEQLPAIREMLFES